MDATSEFADNWKSVWVEIEPGPVAASHEIGYVLVDEARLMFADPDAIGAWRTNESRDGLADLVFWGRDAQTVASELGADTFDEFGRAVYGWRDRPLFEIRQLGGKLAVAT